MQSVILYSTGCPRCDVLKNKLNAKSISYNTNNSVDEMIKMGISDIPVLSVNGVLMKFKEAVDWVNKQKEMSK